MAKKLTGFFPEDVDPVRVGVYGTLYKFYSYWDGSNFHGHWRTPKQAYKFRKYDGSFLKTPWRGLARRPSKG